MKFIRKFNESFNSNCKNLIDDINGIAYILYDENLIEKLDFTSRNDMPRLTISNKNNQFNMILIFLQPYKSKSRLAPKLFSGEIVQRTKRHQEYYFEFVDRCEEICEKYDCDCEISKNPLLITIKPKDGKMWRGKLWNAP